MLNNRQNKGITLIALVVTIIILLILTSVSMNILLGDNGLIGKAKQAKLSTEIEAIKEEVRLYILSQETDRQLGKIREVREIYPLTIGENGDYETLKSTLTQEEIDNLDEDFKVKLYQLEKKVSANQDFTINDVTYDIFYRLDENKIKSAKNYKDKLYFFITDNEYKLLYIDGYETKEGIAYSIIPVETSVKAEYFTAGNNTYKLLKGTLRAIGEKNKFSGFTTTELQQYSGWQELDLARISDNQIVEPIKEELFCNNTAFMIDSNNVLWAWGNNNDNKLGLGNSYTQLKPVKIFENAKQVWSGEMNTYVLDQNGNLWGAGANTNGALGQGNTNVYSNFVKINGIDGNKIIKVLPSYNFETNSTIIYTTDKKVYGLGWIGSNMADINCTTITDLSINRPIYSDVDDVAFHGQTMYILKDGILYGVGRTQDTALAEPGHGNSTAHVSYKSPRQLATNVTKMDMFSYLTNEGYLYFVCDGQGKTEFRQVYNSNDTVFQDIDAKIIINERSSGSPIIYSNGKAYKCSYNSSKDKVYLNQYTNYTNLIECRVFSYKARLQNVMDVVKCDNGKYMVSSSILSNGKNMTQLEFKEVFDGNIITAQGTIQYINLIDKDYNVYTGTNNGYIKENIKAKKVLSSTIGSILLDNNGKIYRKYGSQYGSTGNINNVSTYTALIDESGKTFNTVKDIAVSKQNHIRNFYNRRK